MVGERPGEVARGAGLYDDTAAGPGRKPMAHLAAPYDTSARTVAALRTLTRP
jgi:hypothetical protein